MAARESHLEHMRADVPRRAEDEKSETHAGKTGQRGKT
jgi:hypothetical protein